MRRIVERVRLRGGRSLVAIVIEGASAGPTVSVTANVHGDELTGLVAVQELDRELSAELGRGSVVLYPSLNPMGLEARRRVIPEDDSDLNRLFPGNEQGTPGEQVAAALWSELVGRRPDALIDLHADSAASVPYAIVDRAVRMDGPRQRSMTERLEALGLACGLTFLHEYPDDEYLRFGLDHSLAGAMVNHAGVPALTIEAGPRRGVDPAAVRVQVEAVRRVLHHLGMIASAPGPELSRRSGCSWRRGSAPRTRRAGIFVPLQTPGERFVTGAVLGVVRGLDGDVLEEVRAPAPGIVVSWVEAGWVEARGVTGTLGLEEG